MSGNWVTAQFVIYPLRNLRNFKLNVQPKIQLIFDVNAIVIVEAIYYGKKVDSSRQS